MAYPSELSYTKEHEWVKLEGDVGVIGITKYATNTLRGVIYIGLPAVGAEVQAGNVLGTVEAVKVLTDVFSPVTGTIIAVNSELAAVPEPINRNPHRAWLVKVQLKNPTELHALMSAKEYENYLQEEGSNLSWLRQRGRRFRQLCPFPRRGSAAATS